MRDQLLGLPVKDRDWVVVGATAAAMRARDFKQVGRDFPVFLHPQTREAYALARTERKTGSGHHGFAFDSSPRVTLEADLQRRDLTINAMARTHDGELIDPHGGLADLRNGWLRHTSAAFVEDPLRVLRVARFAALLQPRGFSVAPQTLGLMRRMVAAGELTTLTPERVWQELERALACPAPAEFIQVLRDCGALAVVLPEVDRLFGVPQPAQHHPEIDTGEHILLCLQQARKLTNDPVVVYATLMHDLGKGLTPPAQWPRHPGHEKTGLRLLQQLQQRLPIPKEFAALARLVCEHHTKLHRIRQLKPATVLRLLESLDAMRRPQRLHRFLLACEADARGRTGFENSDYPQRNYLTTVHKAVQGIDNAAVLAGSAGGTPQQRIRQARLHQVTDTMAAMTATGADGYRTPTRASGPECLTSPGEPDD